MRWYSVGQLLLLLAASGCSGASGAPGSVQAPTGSAPAPTPTPSPTPPIVQVPSSNDPVLADMAKAGHYVGEFDAKYWYRSGDLVRFEGKYFLSTRGGYVTSPKTDTTQFIELPLIESGEVTLADDNFDSKPGSLVGRVTDSGVPWSLTGPGWEQARIQDGYLSSSGNTYFLLGPTPAPITEWSVWAVAEHAPIMLTMASSVDLYTGYFDNMWHVNWGDLGVGGTNVWYAEDNLVAAAPDTIFSYNANLMVQPGAETKLTMRYRDKFVFGYVNDKLAFVQVAPLAEALNEDARSVYVQNHSSVFGEERQDRIQLRGVMPAPK